MLFTFLHLLGIGLWLGGATVAVLVISLETAESPASWATVDQMIGKIYAWVVGPGAILGVAAGIAITMTAASQGFGARLGEPPVAAMQGIGLLAGLVEIFVSLPASQRLGRIGAMSDGTETSALAGKYRGRVRNASGFALVLVVIALFFGVIG